MASAAPQLLAKNTTRSVIKAGGMRPTWNTGRTTAVGHCFGQVTGDYKTGRAHSETPKVILSRACVTPAAVPAKVFIGSRRISSSAVSTTSAATARTAAAAAPALRTAAAASTTTTSTTAATTATGAAARKGPASAAAAGIRTAFAAVAPTVAAPRACISSPAAAARKVPRTTAASASATPTPTTAAAVRKFLVSASASPSRTASAVAPAVAAPRVSNSSPAAAAAARTARTSSAPSTARMGASAASTRAATAATSTSCSSSGNPVPVDVDSIVYGEELKGPEDEWDSCVWLARLGERDVVVKQTPFHSPQRAAEIEVLWGKKQAAMIVVTETKARHEAATVVRMKGIFVQPLMVVARGYSRKASSSDSCPDREIITVMPYYPSGDAKQYIEHVATPLIAALKAGTRSLDSVVKELVMVLTRFARAMFLLVSQVHKRGFILIDHKLQNMVYDAAKSRWLLIDAGEVQGCVLGSKRMGPSLCATLYRAPEQEQGKWADARSDIFTCGKCIQVAVSDCLNFFMEALGDGTDALAEAEAALLEALKPLKEDVLQPCCESKPTARASAGAVVNKLRAPRHQQ